MGEKASRCALYTFRIVAGSQVTGATTPFILSVAETKMERLNYATYPATLFATYLNHTPSPSESSRQTPRPWTYSRPSRFAWPSVEGFGHAIWEVMHSGESAYLQIIR